MKVDEDVFVSSVHFCFVLINMFNIYKYMRLIEDYEVTVPNT